MAYGWSMVVEVRGDEVWVDGVRLQLEHRARVAEQLHDGNVVVLYGLDAGSIPRWKGFNNLVAIDAQGNLRWTAPLPDTSADVYVDLVSVEPRSGQLLGISMHVGSRYGRDHPSGVREVGVLNRSTR